MNTPPESVLPQLTVPQTSVDVFKMLLVCPCLVFFSMLELRVK